MNRLRDLDHGAITEAGELIKDPTDEDYAAAARWALRRKSHRLAVQQASAAVAMRPLHEPHLRLLDEVIAKSRAPLELLALPPEGVFFGLCAARARALAKLGRLDEAIDTLFQAVSFSPDTPFAPWAPAWVAARKHARRVEQETVADALIQFSQAMRARTVSEGARANLEAALLVAERVGARRALSEMLLVAEARVLRVLGRDEDAMARLCAAGESPGWEVAIEWASLHGARGERPAQTRWLERARDARPEEPTTYRDLAGAYLEDGDVDAAIVTYERVLERDASSGWAKIGLAYARALTSGSYREADLADAAQSASERTEVRLLQADLSAYVTRLADPIDPIIRVIRSVGSQGAETAARIHVRVRSDAPLAPSVQVTFSLALAIIGREGRLIVEPHPPALRSGPLWKVDASTAHPAVPRPPDVVIEQVLALSRTPFAWEAWCTSAARLAMTLDARDATRLLDAMAHPVQPSVRNVDLVQWVHGFQVAAALIWAFVPEAPAVRHERLWAIAAGTDDWSAGAALLGLRALAGMDPVLRPALLNQLRAALPADDEPLSPLSRALAVTGCELATGESRRDFLRLRARIRSEIAELQVDAERLKGHP